MNNKILIGRLKDDQTIEALESCTYIDHADDAKMLYIDVQSATPESFEQFLQKWKSDTFSNYATKVYKGNIVNATLTFCLPGFETDRNQILSSVVFEGYQRDGNVFNITAKYHPLKS